MSNLDLSLYLARSDWPQSPPFDKEGAHSGGSIWAIETWANYADDVI